MLGEPCRIRQQGPCMVASQILNDPSSPPWADGASISCGAPAALADPEAPCTHKNRPACLVSEATKANYIWLKGRKNIEGYIC